MTLAQLRASLAEKAKRANAVYFNADGTKRDLSDAEKAEITALLAECQDLKAQIVTASANQAHDELGDRLKALGDAGLPIELDDLGKVKDTKDLRKSLGSLFVAGKAYLDVLAKHSVGTGEEKRIPAKRNIISDVYQVKSLITGLSATSAGALVVNDFQGLLAGLGQFQRILTLNDLIGHGQTTSDVVEFVRMTSATNNAAPVLEATSSAFTAAQDVSGGGYKPESAMALVVVTTPVQTIAHWIPATTRALADAGQIRQLIDDFLEYGLREELEDQECNGNGSSPNFDGLTHVSGTQTQAFSTNILETTRKARTKVRTVGRSTPTAYLMNPADWETIDLLQDNEARYFYGGPARMGQPTLWGLPVVECEAVAAGSTIVGDFRKAVLWDREQASIQVSNQHLDFFTRNLVAILAEMRAAFGVIQPNAFVIADLTP